MGYVAVTGGKEAIEASLQHLTYERVKHGEWIDVKTIKATMRGFLDQVMSESSLYSESLAAVAMKQSEGNVEEAVFLLRAHRSTLPRLYYSTVTDPRDMLVIRRISASFKDIPGGQILGPSQDYLHRLIDFSLITETEQDVRQKKAEFESIEVPEESSLPLEKLPKVMDYLRKEGLIHDLPINDEQPDDVTKESLTFPSNRSERLQILTRGQTGAVVSFGYAGLRGYGSSHPNVGEVRVGYQPIHIQIDDEDEYYIGSIKLTEVESFIPANVSENGKEVLEFDIGYGACFGQNETKAIAMSILDHALENPENTPIHDEEFVLLHIDTVESTGFISHLKLPHYVTFQSKLEQIRKIKREGARK
ncbi:carbon-phosphorus lyase [Ureibacillus massiliensis 4400831 = CIP 108448 = CCUG 49529]|uniref:Carbon-phosphorus lyase n=1 Tax=Ureibacillus massiliensis 4400831 = CIP 108448 = CCUG 49529 TaxID=1211035 RepID=A0A0A3IXZ7_9BACL|nr:carbon-phosphorus lyase complex subunit PhnI [Ureibacillus massiliensis]KGR89606.1 carbon-phosphorus lyase [Ureibacillus massiliensis 4400831 = CIP 108448 = CCUG 49529]